MTTTSKKSFRHQEFKFISNKKLDCSQLWDNPYRRVRTSFPNVKFSSFIALITKISLSVISLQQLQDKRYLILTHSVGLQAIAL